MRDKPLILLVDDEVNFLEIISTKLKAVGFDVVVAHNAAEAIEGTRKIQPDLVLMDISMPGETGTDAALTIKQDPEMKDAKIAFLSNLKDPWPRTTTERETLAKVFGMEEFIDKSADLDVIATRVKAILGK